MLAIPGERLDTSRYTLTSAYDPLHQEWHITIIPVTLTIKVKNSALKYGREEDFLKKEVETAIFKHEDEVLARNLEAWKSMQAHGTGLHLAGENE